MPKTRVRNGKRPPGIGGYRCPKVPKVYEAIKEGLEDVEAGRTIPLDDVDASMRRRYAMGNSP